MYFRPAEVELLHGMPTKAEKELGWRRKVSFDGLVREMVEADLVGVSHLCSLSIFHAISEFF